VLSAAARCCARRANHPRIWSSPRGENNSLFPKSRMCLCFARPTRHEGRIARRHETRVGDAVDASASARKANRRAVLPQVSRPVSEVRRAGRTAPTRTAKACGPGTRCWCQASRRRRRPTGLMLRQKSAGAMEARRIRLQGERAISRQTTAQGRPGCFRLRLWFSPCALLAQCSAQGPWVPAGTRSSLRPRLSEGEECEQTSGASRRENAGSRVQYEI
jgi:hypothetical protein